MARFKHFELGEFIASDTAKKKGIDNTPTFEDVERLAELTENLLEPIRESWGSPIEVTSGFRCPELNKAVGGVATSSHLLGYAADVRSANTTKLFNHITEWVKANGVMFDQIFIETKGKTKWVHIGYKNAQGRQRRMISALTIKE